MLYFSESRHFSAFSLPMILTCHTHKYTYRGFPSLVSKRNTLNRIAYFGCLYRFGILISTPLAAFSCLVRLSRRLNEVSLSRFPRIFLDTSRFIIIDISEQLSSPFRSMFAAFSLVMRRRYMGYRHFISDELGFRDTPSALLGKFYRRRACAE